MVALSFVLLSILAVSMLLSLFRKYAFGKAFQAIGLGFSIWLGYLTILTQIGALQDFGFPPRVPLLIVLPAIIVILVVVNRPAMKLAFDSTPLHLPIALQSFRILVELLIFATYQKGIFPQRATFEGLNFDILVGITAVPFSIFVAKKWIRKKGIVVWNLVSICILTVTAYSFISSYYFPEFTGTWDTFQFVEFPYLLLASVLLPIAIFLHAFSLKQVMHRHR